LNAVSGEHVGVANGQSQVRSKRRPTDVEHGPLDAL
jgi:hypothetical protein